jgi:hypothetical protein
MITYGTLLIEIVFPLGLLFKQTASISALALIVFHGILELVLRIAIFSPIIMASLLLFIESEYLLKLIQTCNQLFAG